MSTGTLDSPLSKTITTIPDCRSPLASSATNNSVPPYLRGGTAIKGGAMRAIFIEIKGISYWMQARGLLLSLQCLHCENSQMFCFLSSHPHSFFEFLGAARAGVGGQHSLTRCAANVPELCRSIA